MSLMVLLPLILGIAVLLFGRRLFWLFVGAVGFWIAINWAAPILADAPRWQILVVGLLAGAFGAIAAIVLERFAVAVAGFLVGGHLVARIIVNGGFDVAQLYWVFLIIGGILGAVLLSVVFDWALIVLSSAVGAGMISDSITTAPFNSSAVFLVLLVLGIIAQARQRE